MAAGETLCAGRFMVMIGNGDGDVEKGGRKIGVMLQKGFEKGDVCSCNIRHC